MAVEISYEKKAKSAKTRPEDFLIGTVSYRALAAI
jgi:hypothetical protein